MPPWLGSLSPEAQVVASNCNALAAFSALRLLGRALRRLSHEVAYADALASRIWHAQPERWLSPSHKDSPCNTQGLPSMTKRGPRPSRQISRSTDSGADDDSGVESQVLVVRAGDALDALFSMDALAEVTRGYVSPKDTEELKRPLREAQELAAHRRSADPSTSDGSESSPSEHRQDSAWLAAGFDSRARKRWSAWCSDPEQARAWRQAVRTLPRAQAWAEHFELTDAVDWSRYLRSPEHAKLWEEAGLVPEAARDWADICHAPADVWSLMQAGITPDEATRHIKDGGSVSELIARHRSDSGTPEEVGVDQESADGVEAWLRTAPAQELTVTS